MTNEQIKELREKAANATAGPWEMREDGRRVNLLPNYSIDSSVMTDLGGDPSLICVNLKGKNAAFISAANPDTILKLLDLIEKQQDALKRISKPCAANTNLANKCDCLNGEECANIAREALQ